MKDTRDQESRKVLPSSTSSQPGRLCVPNSSHENLEWVFSWYKTYQADVLCNRSLRCARENDLTESWMILRSKAWAMVPDCSFTSKRPLTWHTQQWGSCSLQPELEKTRHRYHATLVQPFVVILFIKSVLPTIMLMLSAYLSGSRAPIIKIIIDTSE
jgi:hypothetical protein